MESQITKTNIDENNQKYLMIKKITAIFMSIILSLLILLFLYFMSRNSYAFLYIIFFFIMCSDIETVYNYSHSNPITVAQNEIENKDVNDNKEDQIQKLLKKVKKMNKQINKSKNEIENLKRTIQQNSSSDDNQNDEATTIVSSTPSSPVSEIITSSELEKLIDESIKQFESDDMIFVDNDNVD